jgi:hypothetical protein
MKRTFNLIAILLVVGATWAWAQQAPEMPKPGPEQQRLRYFVGDWRTEGDMKASPFGPAGKFMGTDHAVMLGDFFVVTHSDGKGPMGSMKALSTLAYDPKEKVYTYDEYNSMGQHEVSKGTVSGDTWTWTNEEEMGGKTMKGRFILKEVSPTAYTFKYEISEDGNSWTNVMDGKTTKIAKATKAK